MVMYCQTRVKIDSSDIHLGDVNEILVLLTFHKILSQGKTILIVGTHCS